MAEILTRGELFASETVKDLFSKVNGHSTLAKLSQQVPVSFNGNEMFVFTMDDEANLVGEGEKKAAGSINVEPVTMRPVKIEYGARVTDEFMYGSEEKKLEILKAFNEGYSKKVARALDIMAFHKVNPRTNVASELLKSSNSFDTAEIAAVDYDATVPDDNIEEAIEVIAEYADVNGIAMAKKFSSALAKQKDGTGARMYPQLAWGSNPGVINGCPVDVNSTVSFGNSKDKAIVGDFQNYFKWGYAKHIPLEVIPYGDPDQTGKDLKAYNQVYLRAETYIGWAIMDPAAFAIIKDDEA